MLLASGDVGLIPWVPLTQFDSPAETVLQRCRDIVDEAAPPDEHDRLLVVTHVLASLRYNDDMLARYFGGKQKMIEFPAIQNLVAEATVRAKQDDVLRFLRSQFADVPEDIEQTVRRTADIAMLDMLIDHMGDCESLDQFRQLFQGDGNHGGRGPVPE